MEQLKIFENESDSKHRADGGDSMDNIEPMRRGNTITTLEIAEMMNTEHWKILRKLDGQEVNGKHIEGYVEILTDNYLVVSDYFTPSAYRDSSGKENRCYNVTKLGCDFLANKFTGKKGILFTARYVKRFDEMERELAPKVPMTYKEALLETLRLLDENEALEKENAEMKPKAEYFDDLVERNLLTSFRTTAREFGVKEGVLINWLMDRKYIYRDQSNKLRAYSTGKNDELFATKEYKSKHSGHAGTQTLITPKGRETFRILMNIER